MGKTKLQRDQLEVLLRGSGGGVQEGAGVGGTWDVLRLQKDGPPTNGGGGEAPGSAGLGG